MKGQFLIFTLSIWRKLAISVTKGGLISSSTWPVFFFPDNLKYLADIMSKNHSVPWAWSGSETLTRVGLAAVWSWSFGLGKERAASLELY